MSNEKSMASWWALVFPRPLRTWVLVQGAQRGFEGQWGVADTHTYCVPSVPCVPPISTLIPFEVQSLGVKGTSGSWEVDTSYEICSAGFPARGDAQWIDRT